MFIKVISKHGKTFYINKEYIDFVAINNKTIGLISERANYNLALNEIKNFDEVLETLGIKE